MVFYFFFRNMVTDKKVSMNKDLKNGCMNLNKT